MTRNLSQIRNNTVCIESCRQVFELCSKLLSNLNSELNSKPTSKLNSGSSLESLRSTLEMCAKISQVTAQALQLKSDVDIRLSLLCADLCLQCAELCEDQSSQNREDFKSCAAACYSCVRACRMLSSHPSSYIPLYSDIRLV